MCRLDTREALWLRMTHRGTGTAWPDFWGINFLYFYCRPGFLGYSWASARDVLGWIAVWAAWILSGPGFRIPGIGFSGCPPSYRCWFCRCLGISEVRPWKCVEGAGSTVLAASASAAEKIQCQTSNSAFHSRYPGANWMEILWWRARGCCKPSTSISPGVVNQQKIFLQLPPGFENNASAPKLKQRAHVLFPPRGRFPLTLSHSLFHRTASLPSPEQTEWGTWSTELKN